MKVIKALVDSCRPISASKLLPAIIRRFPPGRRQTRLRFIWVRAWAGGRNPAPPFLSRGIKETQRKKFVTIGARLHVEGHWKPETIDENDVTGLSSTPDPSSPTFPRRGAPRDSNMGRKPSPLRRNFWRSEHTKPRRFDSNQCPCGSPTRFSQFEASGMGKPELVIPQCVMITFRRGPNWLDIETESQYLNAHGSQVRIT